MAKIVLSADELLDILHANELIPDQVTEIDTEGEEIKLKVKTSWPVLKSVRVSVRFAGFEDGHIAFELVTNRLIDTFDWLVEKMVDSLRLSEHGGRWEYPALYVDVNRIVRGWIRGVDIDDMTFADGHFCITTKHPSRRNSSADAMSDTDAGTSCLPSL
jgi:hypothetical protein